MNIDDDFIVKTFFGKSGRLNGNYSTIEYIKQHYDKSVLEYLKNRFDDSESLRETFLRIYFKIEKRPKCSICEKPVSYRGKRNKLFNDTCGNSKCACKYREITMLNKYGYTNNWCNEDVKNKIKETKTKKYGDPYYSNKEKRYKTNLSKYGSIAPVNEEIIEKRKQTCFKKYGCSAPAKSEVVLNKMKHTCLERYGVDNYRKSDECLKKIQNTKKINGTVNSSKYEKEIYEWLTDEYGTDDIICQYKDIRYKNPKNGHTYHCDFYIKSLDLFIEIQAYWAHGPHPFDKTNKDDLFLLEQIKNKAKHKKIYERYIIGWTINDVIKRNVAKQNNLKFFECFDRNITKEKFLNIIKTKYDNI